MIAKSTLTLRLAAPFAWMGFIYALSDRPAGDYEGASGFLDFVPALDYVVHGGLYFILASLIYLTLVSFVPARRWLLAADAVVLALMYGSLDEWHQSFVDGRSSSPLDILADVLGASVAVTLWLAIGKIRTQRRRVYVDPGTI